MTSGGAAPPGGAFADQAFAAAAGAYARTPGEWEQAIRAAIAELFGFLSRHRSQTLACMAGDGDAGREALTDRDRVIARFATLLAPGFDAASAPPPPVVAEAIGGGIYELVRAYALERRLGELPDAVPDATVVALSPFLGAQGASAVAGAARSAQATR
ncbi:MAG TPA: hypothetical protein VNO82_15075 [Solirubrobacteraceae bacterium]|nr:hypothetical protein [Solirubrobacteraceae bacterium]